VTLRRSESLNTAPLFIDTLEELVREALAARGSAALARTDTRDVVHD
jgi:hypothetical protein